MVLWLDKLHKQQLIADAICPGERGGSLDLKVHCRCFPAVLLDLILDVLPFVERAQSRALDCGDVDEHVLAATLQLNESIALIRIEPLHRAARHCRSPIDDAQILSGFVAWQPRRLPSCAHLDFGAPPPWSRRRRKSRIKWLGIGQEKRCACSHSPSRYCLPSSRSHRRRRRRPIARTAVTAFIPWLTAYCGSTPAPVRSRSAARGMPAGRAKWYPTNARLSRRRLPACRARMRRH